MHASRRISLALFATCLSLCPLVAAAQAATPATVTVRVEGLTETKLPPTQVTTTTAPVVKDGNAEHACTGTSALGALQLAVGGDWSGPWNSGFKQYEIYAIEGETHVFEPGAPANYFWSLWIDEKEAEFGACEAELKPGDRVLFFPSCYGTACPATPSPLGIEAPASADVGESVTVTVKRFSSAGVATAAAGMTVTGEGANVTTDANGRAALTFSHAGEVMLRASGPEAVRSETAVCVHAGNDGTCDTQASTAKTGSGQAETAPSSAPSGGGVASFASHYTGPYALVASASGLIDGHVYARGRAPKLLAGSISGHSPVTSVSLELRRSDRGRCYAYDGIRERFLAARCGMGSFFKVSSDGVYSYLLPAALAPGRYVLDIRASDVAGNSTTLARGTSRIVFYVR